MTDIENGKTPEVQFRILPHNRPSLTERLQAGKDVVFRQVVEPENREALRRKIDILTQPLYQQLVNSAVLFDQIFPKRRVLTPTGLVYIVDQPVDMYPDRESAYSLAYRKTRKGIRPTWYTVVHSIPIPEVADSSQKDGRRVTIDTTCSGGGISTVSLSWDRAWDIDALDPQPSIEDFLEEFFGCKIYTEHDSIYDGRFSFGFSGIPALHLTGNSDSDFLEKEGHGKRLPLRSTFTFNGDNNNFMRSFQSQNVIDELAGHRMSRRHIMSIEEYIGILQSTLALTPQAT